MVFSSFLSACAANINIKTTVCTIFSLPATKIQYPATAAGNRVTERPQADRQNPDGRLRRRRAGPVVHRSSAGPENAAGRSHGTRSGKGSPGDGEPDNTRRAESDRTGLTEQTTHNGARKTGAQPGRPDEKPGRAERELGRAERETRAGRKRDSGEQKEKPGRAERETRAGRDEKPGQGGTRDPGGAGRETRAGHKKTDRNLQIAVRRFGSGSLTSRFSYRSALRNGS